MKKACSSSTTEVNGILVRRLERERDKTRCVRCIKVRLMWAGMTLHGLYRAGLVLYAPVSSDCTDVYVNMN